MTTEWRHATRCSAAGDSVEIRQLSDGSVQLRHSDRPADIITYTAAEMAAFLGGAKDGDFDDLIDPT